MSTIDRAAEVIAPWIDRGWGYPEDHAESAAHDLADEGLLADNRPDAPDFIKKHPVPWKLARTIFEGEEADGITDAQGALIARTADASGYQSWLEGDMDEFIDFVNKHFADHAEEVGRADS